jgi:hypothetical protein
MNDMYSGRIEIDGDGNWTIFIRGKAGLNPFDALTELISKNTKEYESMKEAAAIFLSQAISSVQ